MPNSSRYLKAMPRLQCLIPIRAATNQWLLVVPIVVALGITASSAVAAPAFYDGNSADGSIAVFSSKEQMVPGDTDQELDVYVRSFDTGLGEYLTREVSIGPAGGNDAQPAIYDGMSSDGTEIFFSTNEPMVAADSDHREDIYARNLSENRTVLVSQGSTACAGQGCGNGAFDASFLPGGVAPEGGVVFFGSKEILDGVDQDGGFDIYVRDIAAETTHLVSVADASCGTCVERKPRLSVLGYRRSRRPRLLHHRREAGHRRFRFG